MGECIETSITPPITPNPAPNIQGKFTTHYINNFRAIVSCECFNNTHCNSILQLFLWRECLSFLAKQCINDLHVNYSRSSIRRPPPLPFVKTSAMTPYNKWWHWLFEDTGYQLHLWFVLQGLAWAIISLLIAIVWVDWGVKHNACLLCEMFLKWKVAVL